MTPLSPLSLLAALPPKGALPSADPALTAQFAALLDEIAPQGARPATAESDFAEPAASEGLALPDPVPAMPPAAILPEPGKVLPEPASPEIVGQAPAPVRQDRLYPLAMPGQTVVSPIQAPLPASEPAPDALPPQASGQPSATTTATPLPAPELKEPAFGTALVPQPRERPAPAQEPQFGSGPVSTPDAQAAPVPARVPADAAARAITAPLRQVLAAARLDADRPAPPPAGTEPAALFVPTSAEGPPSAPILTPREPLAQRPIDFAALVDRLAAAREAVQPQSMAIALPHAEFGRIALRFHYDETGLAVSMASPDPDFARAAAQALPPVQATAPAEQPLTGSGQNSSSAPADRGQGHGEAPAQTRQPPRDSREQPRGQAAAEPHQEPTDRPGRQGIFA